MLIEQSAYANRWRRVSPAAKGVFALAGLVAAFAAASPVAALAVAAVLVLLTLVGAGVPLACYLRVAVPPLLFLAASSLSLAFSLAAEPASGELALHAAPAAATTIATVGARSLAALAALLFLALSTPFVDLLALLRRLRVPEIGRAHV